MRRRYKINEGRRVANRRRPGLAPVMMRRLRYASRGYRRLDATGFG